MNDPLKKYIQDNRDDFDNLEPSAQIFLKLKEELQVTPKEKTTIISFLNRQKWVVAASILITLSLSYLLFKKDQVSQDISTPKIVKRSSPTNTDKVVNDAMEIVEKMPRVVAVKHKTEHTSINLLAVYRDLTDSTSASTRLASILELQKSTIISYDIIDRLTNTLNHDSNSNVRLAALNLMSKYAQDSYVNNAFMLSLSNQRDPLLQLGLMELLSQTDNPKLDDKLYALANDPNTLSEVKDQAYLILLNQNKL